MPDGAISCDVDTLESIYQGRGLAPGGHYSYAELDMGLETMCRLFERAGVRATLFMVGRDLRRAGSAGAIRHAATAGHELASHSDTHPQGFRHLPRVDQEQELARAEESLVALIGRRPLGFRSPGWNAGADAADLLARRGYLYDSSVFPSPFNLSLKALHWWATRGRPWTDRTTLGPLSHAFAPTAPYRASRASLSAPGADGVIEFPVTVAPRTRLPFFATFHLATGYGAFRRALDALVGLGEPVQYQFHLSDFVDYTHPLLASQVPAIRGVYIPKALVTPLARKLDLFSRVIDDLGTRLEMSTLGEWAARFAQSERAS